MPLVWQGNQTSYTDNTWNLGINTAGTFTLITNGAIDAFVAWGDGTSERLTATSGTTNFSHTYSPAGTYTVQIQNLSGDFRPYFNNDAAGDELVTVGDTPAGWSFGTNLTSAFFGSNYLTTIGSIDTSAVTSFQATWLFCNSLESFPLIDTSKGTSFGRTWEGCSSLPSFPLIDTSSGTNFNKAWLSCTGLTSFPSLSTLSGTSFSSAWANCNSLTDFPANFFDSWTATPSNNCFVDTWDLCSSLTATSVENILNSLAASAGQQNAPAAAPVANENDIDIDYNDNGGLGPFPYGASLVGGVLDPVPESITTLKNRSPAWKVFLNGVEQ